MMGKKKQTKNPGAQSAGIHSTANRSILKAVRRSKTTVEKRLDQIKAWKKANGGKNDPWITIANPNTAETKKRFIRVKACQVWGSPKFKHKPAKETMDV
jgi:DNA gyrase inhibitor GyrI